MPEIRKVNIRKFQQHLFEELKDIPVVVTRKGKDAFIIIPCEEEVKE